MKNKITRIIVCGGKTEHPQEIVDEFILGVLAELGVSDCVIVSGGCKGADISGERFAETRGFEVVRFLPDWKTYGRSAGIRRNAEMINYISQSERPAVIAFWNGESRGTKFTIEQAKKKGIPVYIYYYKSKYWD
ncbi:MAG: DUF2493 domain-containing protein [Ruminococcus sp.]|nr:DUF2493 domain-containing protein [Ruminococcus sp.]